MKSPPQPVKAGRVELSQSAPDGDVKLLHRNKDGKTVEIVIPARVVERWAVRQIRQEAFA